MKILITGGHVTPAIAVIDHIRANYKEIDIVFVGRKYAIDSEQTLSLEYKEITDRHIRFFSLHAGRMNRIISLRSLKQLCRVPLGFISAISLICREKPDVVLSFGGYIALPIAVSAWFCRIPVYTHEQTMSPGIANRIIGFFSKKVFFSFPGTEHYFPKSKRVYTGNPIRDSIYQEIEKPFNLVKNRKVIYVTGGSLGSHSINEHVRDLLPELLKTYIVIHQIGEVKEYNDYEKLVQFKKKLPPELGNQYYPAKHFFHNQIGYIYKMADIVIGRSGANTCYELLALKKPAILIPLPWSAHKEQQKHAELFMLLKVGEIFEQKDDSKNLQLCITTMFETYETYKKQFELLPFSIPRNAAELITKEILRK